MADAPDARLRLFVAVAVPEDRLMYVQERVAPISERFPGARWTDPANQHVTLKFLGWVDAAQLGPVVDACERVASNQAPGSLGLGSLGAFPTKKRVRVLWVGLDDSAGLLGGMARSLDAELKPLGFGVESRSFTPHLTLARLKAPLRLAGDWPKVDFDARAWTCRELTLFRSHLSPKGARYEVVRALELGGVAR